MATKPYPPPEVCNGSLFTGWCAGVKLLLAVAAWLGVWSHGKKHEKAGVKFPLRILISSRVPNRTQITLLGLSNEPKTHCWLTSAFKNQCSIGTLTKELVFFRNKCEWLESLHWPSFHHTPPRAKLPNLQGSQPSKAIQKFPKTIFDYETNGCQSKRFLASNEKISKFGIPKNLRLTSNRELPGVKDRQRWTSISLSPSAQRSALLAKNLTLHGHQAGTDKVVNLHLLCKRFSFRSKPHNQFQKRIII